MKSCHGMHSPFYADSDEREDRGVESDDQDIAVHLAHGRAEDPTTVQDELDDLGNPKDQDEQVGERQVHYKDIRRRTPHASVAEDHADHEQVTSDAYEADAEEKYREGNDGFSGSRHLGDGGDVISQQW